MTDTGNEKLSGPGAGLGVTGASTAEEADGSDYGDPGGDGSAAEESADPGAPAE